MEGLLKLSLLREAEFKEFEPQFKFETRLKYGCFHFKLQLNVSGFKPVLSWYRFLAAIRCGSNSLNSDSVPFAFRILTLYVSGLLQMGGGP